MSAIGCAIRQLISAHCTERAEDGRINHVQRLQPSPPPGVRVTVSPLRTVVREPLPIRKLCPSSALAWLGVIQAYAVGLVLHLQHRHAHEAHAINPTLHWLRDSTLAVPLSLVVLAVGTALTRLLFGR